MTTPTTITLTLPLTTANPQSAILFIQVANPDGSAPTLAVDSSASNQSFVKFIQPYANDNSYPRFPPQQYPYIGVITAVAAATGLVNLQGDGVTSQQFNVTVENETAQTATVPAGAILYVNFPYPVKP